MASFRKLGAALLVIVALGVVFASSSFAAATTSDVQWYTGSGTGTLLSGVAAIGSSLSGTSGTLTTTAAGTTYTLHFTGIDCSSCTFSNSGGTAVGSGELVFTGVTITAPPGCTVPSTIRTDALSIRADWMNGSVDYFELEPTAGPTAQFAMVAVTNCAQATSLPLKGTLFTETTNATGTPAVQQQVNSSPTINSTAGGTLHVGTETASLTFALKFRMTGTHEGQEFQTH